MASWLPSLQSSFRPQPPQRRAVRRRCRIDFRYAAPVLFNPLAPVVAGNAARRKVEDDLLEQASVILDQRVHEAGLVTLFATHQTPDQLPVAGLQLVDASLLLDHLWTVQFQPPLPEGHQVAAQAGRDRHAAETAD